MVLSFREAEIIKKREFLALGCNDTTKLGREKKNAIFFKKITL